MTGPKGLRSSPAAFSGLQEAAGWEAEQLQPQLVPIWDSSNAEEPLLYDNASHSTTQCFFHSLWMLFASPCPNTLVSGTPVTIQLLSSARSGPCPPSLPLYRNKCGLCWEWTSKRMGLAGIISSIPVLLEARCTSTLYPRDCPVLPPIGK